MKKILMIALALILCLSAVGCTKQNYPWPVTKAATDTLLQDEQLKMTIKEDTLTPTGATPVIYNGTDEDLFIGRVFYIQLCTNGAWYNIEGEPTDWPMDLLIIKPGNTSEEPANWSSMYGPLPVGKYRLVKPYTVNRSTLDEQE